MLPPTSPVVAWLFSLMLQAAPPDRLAEAPQLPLHEETASEKRERYADIAEDLFAVAYDPALSPLFRGPRGRATTAALVLAVAFHESGFAHDVDKGPCYRGPGYERRCDGGAAACLMQLEVGDGTTVEGWSRGELFADRDKCFRAGIAKLRRSMRACAALPPAEQLSVYAQGSCASPVGRKKARELYGQFRSFVGKAPLPGPDALMLMSVDAPDS